MYGTVAFLVIFSVNYALINNLKFSELYLLRACIPLFIARLFT